MDAITYPRTLVAQHQCDGPRRRDRLDRLALSRGSRITRALAQEVLGEMVGGEE